MKWPRWLLALIAIQVFVVLPSSSRDTARQYNRLQKLTTIQGTIMQNWIELQDGATVPSGSKTMSEGGAFYYTPPEPTNPDPADPDGEDGDGVSEYKCGDVTAHIRDGVLTWTCDDIGVCGTYCEPVSTQDPVDPTISIIACMCADL